jgi:dimethylglycine dehydrogenase
MTEHARVVVIGGGAVGCSVLYHLAELGWTDCLLLERDELTAGSTWHAAGNCPTFSASFTLMRLQAASARLYARLAAAADPPVAYHVTGSLRLAHGAERMAEFRHVRAMAEAQGLGYELLRPAEARERYPFMTLDDLAGALWDPNDGDIDPSQLTQALAAGARARGCRIRRGTRVTGIARRADGSWRLATDRGEVACEIVVNAAGYRAAEVMALLGETLPLVTMSHQYLVTEPIPALARRAGKLPLLRDPDISYYLRQEGHGLLLGPYEAKATPMWLEGMPADFARQLFADDLERLEWYIAKAIERVPLLGEAGVQRVINGPIPYSPDGNPYLGPAPGLPGFFQCCCFSFGIAQAGGAGQVLAEWLVHGEPSFDLWPIDPRRFTGYATRSYVTARAVELYRMEYAIGFPCEERPAGRPARTSPLYDLLAAKGARFGARGGWERAVWFAPAGGREAADLTWRRARGWFEPVGAECRAIREAVGLLDLPGMTKFEITGPGAAAWLDRLICTRLPQAGRIGLGYLLSGRGGILSELTIIRLAADRFYLVGAAAAEWHDEDLLRAALPADGSVRLDCMTGRLGTLVLAGPKARAVLEAATGADLGNTRFPWLAARRIEIGMAPVLALRLNYVGELGWELHAPVEHLRALYEALWHAGTAHGLRDIGLYAVDSLRLDKGYPAWKAELVQECSPLAAGLERFVAWRKPDFIGRGALLAERAAGPRERLVLLVLAEPGDADAPPGSLIRQDGAPVGLVTSGGWSYTLEASLALGYVRADLAMPGTRLEIEVLGERRAAEVAKAPLVDPDNARLRS